jgi:hypothetical protein
LMKKVHYMPLLRQKTAIKRIGDILGIRPIIINYEKRVIRNGNRKIYN